MAGTVRAALMRFIALSAFLALLYLLIGAVFEQAVLSRSLSRAVDSAEEAALKDTVTLFNKIYSDLYASDGVPARLNEFPTTKQLRHELFRHLGFLREKGLVLVFDMADLVFVDIKRLSGDRAEVTTFEEWNYIYQDMRTREPVERIKGMGQGFRYVLVKRGGRWMVVDYYPADVKVEKRDEFLF